ncbi:MAG TPA: hypothetical protein PKO18_01820 [Chitinophagales bacterium]|nr:hypothetical protein [Chitinophagales bacterium]
MRKVIQLIIPLLIYLQIGCQEKGMERPFSYVFWIKDILGNNLLGDSSNPNRYHIDSIRYNYIIGGVVVDTMENELEINYSYYKGYFLSSLINTNTEITALLKYNNIEKDTIQIIYGKDNIKVFQNSQLIFSKNNLSQIPPEEFNIIK